MIDKLTSAQEAMLPVYRDRWIEIGLSTGPVDRLAVEAAMGEVYRCGGLEPPREKLWLGSPHAGLHEFLRLDESAVGSAVRSAVESSVGSAVWSAVESAVRSAGYGTHDASWLAFYQFFRRELNLRTETEKLSGLIHLAEAGCGWWWPMRDRVIITERPELLARDERGRLHSEDGPAVRYPDGWSIWSWHGVQVEQRIIERPETITTAEVLTEENQEVRRVMLERYGWLRLLADLEAVVVHEDLRGRLYETRRLGEYLTGEDPVARFVRVVDPSTGREYALRVPPDVQTASAAVGWTFGIEEKQYAPEQEA